MTNLEIRRLALETASKHCPPDFDASALIEQARVIENYLNGNVMVSLAPSVGATAMPAFKPATNYGTYVSTG